MIHKFLPKMFSLQFLNFIIILTIPFSEQVDIIEKESIIKNALQNGYNLTNPNDDFFLDLCIYFSYHKKDVTLEYRQKNFYFPNDSNSPINFIHPKRNNTFSCFTNYPDIKQVLINIAIIIEFPIFIFQLTVILFAIYINPENIFNNTPEKQAKVNKKRKKLKNASELVEEKKENEDNNETNIAVLTKNELNIENGLNNNENNHGKKESNAYLQTDIVKINSEIKEENNLEKETKKNLKENKDEINKINEVIINKNEDYITFGLNPVNNENIIKAQEEMNKNKKKLSKKEKIKMTKIISKELNEERFDVNNISDSSNNIRGKNKKNEEKAKIYSREEFFYLEFEKEIISDERSIFEMYLDLLNQCQFLFKFFCISYNIYEDRKLQLLYYTFKINLYFLFNIILTTNNVINKIFDNKKRFK